MNVQPLFPHFFPACVFLCVLDEGTRRRRAADVRACQDATARTEIFPLLVFISEGREKQQNVVPCRADVLLKSFSSVIHAYSLVLAKAQNQGPPSVMVSGSDRFLGLLFNMSH